MVRAYDVIRPVPAEVTDRIISNGLRAPSAGFSQGWAFLVLDKAGDVARFREVVRPEDHPGNWFAASVDAPLLIIPHSNKDAYLDRYALPDKGSRTARMPGGQLPTGISIPVRVAADAADRGGCRAGCLFLRHSGRADRCLLGGIRYPGTVQADRSDLSRLQR